MSRPDYSALGAAVSLTDLTLTGNGGNPNLKPIRAAVYDAALEWYYAPTGVAAVSVFYDDLSSYVGYGVSTGSYLNLQKSTIGVPGAPNNYVYSLFTISSPNNISGQLKGVEMQVQQPLPYNFGFQANFTYVDGQDDQGNPLVGTSQVDLQSRRLLRGPAGQRPPGLHLPLALLRRPRPRRRSRTRPATASWTPRRTSTSPRTSPSPSTR